MMGGSSKSPSALMCCRGCLATNVKLFDIHKNKLAEAFGSITGYPVSPSDGFPQKLCRFCGSLLAKSAAFRARCRRAHDCLRRKDQHERTMNYIKNIDRLSCELVFTLAVTQVEVVELGAPPLNEVKEEMSIVDEETSSKDEDTESFNLGTDEEFYYLDVDYIHESDIDDENSDEIIEIGNRIEIEKVLIPTDRVEVKKGMQIRKTDAAKEEAEELKKPRARGPSPTGEYQPNFDVAAVEKELNVDIEILNKEQQLAAWREFSARKKAPAAFCCEECGKGFDHQDTYSNHLLRHSPIAGAFRCEVCRVRFARRSERRQHRQRHALRYTCRQCQFVTRTKAEAKLHHSSHAGRQYQCQHCARTFIKRSSFLSHVRLAHAALNVPCADCGETFVSRLGLTLHQAKMHKAQKAASKCECPSCGAAFDNPKALDAHLKVRAGGDCDPALRPCAACGASLPSEEALWRHTEKFHKKEFQCTECPLKFSGEEPRETHYWRVHCEQRRKDRPRYRAGPRPDPPPPGWRSRVCARCGKQCQNPFMLRQHMRSHTGERPYACPDCTLRFAIRSNLQRHQLVVHLGQRPMVKCPECGKRLGAASLATHIKYVHRKLPQKPRVRRSNTEK